jgi:hypothetical protein
MLVKASEDVWWYRGGGGCKDKRAGDGEKLLVFFQILKGNLGQSARFDILEQ